MASTYLQRTPATATNRRTFTLSTWLKKSVTGSVVYILYGGTGTGAESGFYFDSADRLEYFEYSGGYSILKRTNRLFRDTSAWYHIVLAVDTTQATADDRVKIYVNGVQETSFVTSTDPSQNFDSYHFNNTSLHTLGAYATPNYYFNGCMAHYHWIDGTAYAASTFGESDATSGVWKPKTAPSVTYGTNGFFLKFANSASLGTDSSGNGNNFTVNGSGTQTLDTPSNVYCTINPLDNYFQQATFTNGNNGIVTGSSQSTYTRGTLGMSAGKWYWEMKMTNTSPLGNLNFGIVNAPSDDPAQRLRGASTTNSVAATDYNYAIYANGVSTGINGEIVAQNDIVMFAFDADNNGLYIGRNGSWYNSGDPTSGASKTGAFTPGTAGLDYFPAIGDENGSAGYSVQFNFGNGYFGTTAISSPNNDGAGEGKFAYAPPTGYYALNTKNLKTYG